MKYFLCRILVILFSWLYFHLKKTRPNCKMDHKPKLIVFDLDYTLWPFWADTHVTLPFRKDKNGEIYDYHNWNIKLYPDTLAVLEHLHNDNYQMVVASRTSAIEEAEALLNILDLNKFFTIKQIYPGKKTAHFATFHEKTKIPYEDMLFFDDEERNIRDLSKIGVTCHYITSNGMTWDDLHKGLESHKKKKQAR